jgi:hypothetical protein
MINRMLLITLFLLCLNTPGYCQKYLIEIQNGFDYNKDYFNVQINRDSDKLEVTYKKPIKFHYGKINKAKSALKERLAKEPLSPEDIAREVNSIYEKYTRFSIDKIVIPSNTYTYYINLLDSIYMSDKDLIINEILNKNRIVLDGTTVNIRISSGIVIHDNYYLHSPTLTSHPIAFRFIRETLNLYYIIKNKQFLDNNRFKHEY